MKRLYIGSMSSFSGKTLLTLGLSLNLKEKGYRLGYIKPVGKEPVNYNKEVVDADALFFKDLLGLDEPSKTLSPFVSTLDTLSRTLSGRMKNISERIINAIEALKDADITLIAGTRDIFEGSVFGINGIKIVEQTGAKALMVESWNDEETLDDIFGAREMFGETLVGVVLNRVREEQLDFIGKKVRPYLKTQKIDVLGVIPFESILSAVTVQRLVEVLGGRVLCAEEGLNELVENFSIGAMDVNNALKYFKRTPNKAVITGAHRSDIQLAALETSTNCIILTGGLLPNDVIIGKAKLEGIPLISVKEDTFTTIDRIQAIMGKLRIREKDKMLRAKKLVKDHVNIPALLRRLGINRK